MESDDARLLQPDARLGDQAERTVVRGPRPGPLFLRGLLLEADVGTAATPLFCRGGTRSMLCFVGRFGEVAGGGGWGVMLPFACVGYRAV